MATTVLKYLLIVVSFASAGSGLNSEGAVSHALLRRGVGCFVAQNWAVDELHEIGLKVGDIVAVRHETGSISGMSPVTSETTNIMITTPSGKRGVLFFIDFGRDENLAVKRNAYLLRQTEDGWSASEGNGGIGAYKAISDYADKLSQVAPTKMRLRPDDSECQVE